MHDIETKDLSELTSERFWTEYAAPQRPVVVRGVECWAPGEAPNPERLLKLSHHPIHGESSFWNGPAFKHLLPKEWTFADYVRHLQDGNLPMDEHGGHPYLIGISIRGSSQLQ